MVAQPTLAHYLFPQEIYVCALAAIDDQLKPHQLDTKDHGWSSPIVKVDNKSLVELDQWVPSYAPSDVNLCYDRPGDVLIKPPARVIVHNQEGTPVTCFFKQFKVSFSPSHAKEELAVLKRIAQAQIPPPPEAYICRLHRVVRDGNGLVGMLFVWIDKKGVLSRARAAMSSARHGIIWGDAKADNVLIDKNDDAWIIDFGGNYTPGWVDEDKSGTLEGDKQGLASILDLLDGSE
ncbi:hypothetical protein MRS44_016919 [Fusarium solani]|uniref:uncharacterized protein n=1 Tax=Fusarium solani TaxID=169388 RepID=UPI0032C48DA0|nr:hypothetical protein MRS44_016919 [Fusarium solani]